MPVKPRDAGRLDTLVGIVRKARVPKMFSIFTICPVAVLPVLFHPATKRLSPTSAIADGLLPMKNPGLFTESLSSATSWVDSRYRF